MGRGPPDHLAGPRSMAPLCSRPCLVRVRAGRCSWRDSGPAGGASEVGGAGVGVQATVTGSTHAPRSCTVTWGGTGAGKRR